MRSVNIAELKNRLSQYLNEVRSGTEIVVRDRNTPIARILPIEKGGSDDETLQALAGRGKLRLGGQPVGGDFWKLPAPRVSASALRRAVDLERDEG
jgi:prevent-host-death family protein